MLKTQHIVLSALLVFLSAFAISGESASEPALALSMKDKQLQWGPCPSFIPKGCQIAVLHGDPSRENSDIYFKVPGGFTIPEHWHTSAERMVLVSGKLDLTYQGQKTKTLKAGMYAYGPAKAHHKAVCANGPACILFIAFEGPVDAMPAAADKP